MSGPDDTADRDWLAPWHAEGAARDVEDGAAEALYAAVAAATVDRPRTVRERVLAWTTPVRVGVALALSLALCAGLLAVGGGPHARGFAATDGIGIGVAALVCAGAIALSLRGAYRRQVRAWITAFATVALAAPLLLAALSSGDGHVAPPGSAWSCLALGLVTGALTAGVAWAFQRDDRASWWRVTAAVAGGGLMAFAVSQVHCPARDVGHVLVGHAVTGLVWLILAAASWPVLRRRQTSGSQ